MDTGCMLCDVNMCSEGLLSFQTKCDLLNTTVQHYALEHITSETGQASSLIPHVDHDDKRIGQLSLNNPIHSVVFIELVCLSSTLQCHVCYIFSAHTYARFNQRIVSIVTFKV